MIKELQKLSGKSQFDPHDIEYAKQEMILWIELLVMLIVSYDDTHWIKIMIQESDGSLHPIITEKVKKKPTVPSSSIKRFLLPLAHCWCEEKN